MSNSLCATLVAERLLLPEDADRELRQLLNDRSRNGALPLRGGPEGGRSR